ncbi:hypothetical protein Tco_1272855 [Tanacetum coccineum]
MSMMGELNFFLLQIKQMKDRIFFNQSKYIKEMLKKFGLEDSKPTKTPMSTEIKLTKDDEADSVDSTKYQVLSQIPTYLSISFTIRNKDSIMSLEKFGKILQIPFQGTCVFSKECSLELLNPTHEKHIFYQSNIPKIPDVISSISMPSNHQNHSNLSIVYRDDLLPNIKYWELILRENVICSDTHKSSIDACSAIMLYHLQTCQRFNLAYYIAHKIKNVKNRVDCPLPYGLLITRLYKHVLAQHPPLFRPHSKLYFVLNYRMMNSINGKNWEKEG